MTGPQNPIVNFGTKYADGLKVGFLDATHVFVDPGAARDSTNTNDIILKSNIRIDITAIGANGLDTGTLTGATMYAVHLIGDSSGYNPTAAMISLSATSPILPLGYDMFRRIGWMLTDAFSHVTLFNQYGDGKTRTYYYDQPLLFFSGAHITTFLEVTLAASVPILAAPFSADVLCQIQFQSAAAADKTDFTAFNNGIPLVSYSNGFVGTAINTIWLPTNNSDSLAPSIFLRTTSNSDSATLSTIGYKDYIS